MCVITIRTFNGPCLFIGSGDCRVERSMLTPTFRGLIPIRIYWSHSRPLFIYFRSLPIYCFFHGTFFQDDCLKKCKMKINK